MIKYYTRACNFYYGKLAKFLIKKKKALPLCGNNHTAFDQIEIFSRKYNKIKSQIININGIKTLSKDQKKKYFKRFKKDYFEEKKLFK